MEFVRLRLGASSRSHHLSLRRATQKSVKKTEVSILDPFRCCTQRCISGYDTGIHRRRATEIDRPPIPSDRPAAPYQSSLTQSLRPSSSSHCPLWFEPDNQVRAVRLGKHFAIRFHRDCVGAGFLKLLWSNLRFKLRLGNTFCRSHSYCATKSRMAPFKLSKSEK
jgi:hypothetical protein